MKEFNPALKFFLFDVALIVIMILIYRMCY